MSRQAGFSLLEMLVVAALLVTLTGFALLSVDFAAGGSQIRRETNRLSELIRWQCEQAQLQGYSVGVLMQSQGYAFAQLHDQQWRLTDDEPFQPRSFPAGTVLSLRVSEHAVALSDDQVTDQVKPQVACFDSGELTPFTLTLANSDSEVVLTGALDGKLEQRITN